MGEKKAKYGIWGGRFQIIHKGHEFVLQYVAKHYPNVCIGIVNPNPAFPAWNTLEHEKFEPKRNPFTYFQRAYLWNLLLRYHSIEAVIVPHWHPRKSLELESTFLPYPQKSREWVIPYLSGEEYKIEDFENAGEIVCILYDEEPAELKLIHASEIRHLFCNGNNHFKAYIPEKIQLATEKFLKGENLDEQFIIVPILKDNLHPLLICGGIQLAFDTNKKLIFAPVVYVRDEDKWWRVKPIEDYFTFYQKYEMINIVMKGLQFYDYMVLPIIVKNNQCEAIDAFMPDSNRRTWFFINRINSSSVFKQIRSEEILTIDTKTVSNDIYVNVFISITDLYNQRHYFDNFFNDDESEGDDQMSKYDLSNVKANTVNIVEGNIEGGVHSNTYVDTEYSSAEDIIAGILKTSNEAQFKELLQKADETLANKSQSETQRIIEDTVKKHIDSAEKKNLFLQKVKQFTFNISNSIVAGLLLQVIKNLVFGA